MTTILPHLLLESAPHPKHCIIWLHGLGADGYDFEPMVDELQLNVPMRYIFPHAPQRPVTINGGYIMRAWYDIKGQNIDAQQDEAGIRASQAAVEALISQQIEQGIAAENIFLAGFSQGGAIVLQTGLRSKHRLAGIMALSTYLPLHDSLAAEKSPHSPPIFMAHGRSDNVVSYSLGTLSREALSNAGCAVEWKEYNMAHSVCATEMQDIETWLNKHLG